MPGDQEGGGGAPSAPAAPQRAGADRLQALVDETPLHRALGLQVASVTASGLVLRAQPSAEHAVAQGQLHGGAVAMLLDTAATFALIGVTGDDWGTVDLRVDYLRPAPVAPLEAAGRVLHAGRRLGRAAAELIDPETGRVVASAVGTFVRQAPEEA